MSKDVAAKAKEAKPKANFFKRIGRFFKELKSEVKKVVWPSRKQVVNNTCVVLAFMGVSAIAIWVVDFIFIKLMSLIF